MFRGYSSLADLEHQNVPRRFGDRSCFSFFAHKVTETNVVKDSWYFINPSKGSCSMKVRRRWIIRKRRGIKIIKSGSHSIRGWGLVRTLQYVIYSQSKIHYSRNQNTACSAEGPECEKREGYSWNWKHVWPGLQHQHVVPQVGFDLAFEP